MTEQGTAFGRLVALAADPAEFLGLEQSAGGGECFAQVDRLIADVVRRLLRRERLASVAGDDTQGVALLVLDPEQRALVAEVFSLEHQQARGAWFLPEEASIKVGLLNLPFYFRDYPRFATGLALEERARVRLHGSAEALLVWALLEPLVERLFEPFVLRGPAVGVKDRDEQLAAWASVDQFTAALGLNVADALAVMRYGGGWHRLGSAQQLAAKQRLLDALANQVTDATVRRYRASLLHPLIIQYYEKAKKRSTTRRQVVAGRTLQRTLAGYFGGDWLAFLAYIGETPSADERIATALPETRLQVSGAARAAEVAGELGLPAAEVERMLAAYWERPTGASPIEERVAVMRRFWQVLDAAHARQTSGMRPLWGLVEDNGFFSLPDDTTESVPYQPELYHELLPADLLADIERLWGTTMLPRWPERLVTQPFAHFALADTFGPALKFWHGCALTAWFICEGPTSRTDIAGMPQYYRAEVAELAELGCPVDGGLFADLLAAEKHLGPSEPIPSRITKTGVAPSISMTLQLNQGQRRRGFERLRDIVTRYRQAWTDEHLERYLRARWERELRALGREYNRLIEDKGKAPTPKQFASRAATAANHWFGGDISALYVALGEKVSLRPTRSPLMPDDRVAFAWSVFRALGGVPFHRQVVVASTEEADELNEQRRVYSNLKRLAEYSLWYVQLKEALGRPPGLREFGRTKFEWASPTLADDVDEAWERYRRAIEATLSRQPPTKPRLVASSPIDHSSQPSSPDYALSVGRARQKETPSGYLEC